MADRVKVTFEGKTMADVIRQMVDMLMAVNVAKRKEGNENGADQSAGSGNAGAGQRQQ